MIRIFLIPVVLLLGGSLFGCVTPQDFYPYDERIYRLEQRVQQQDNELKRNRDRFSRELTAARDDTQQTRNQSASLTATLDSMRQETRQLRGLVEELEYRLKQELGTAGQTETRHIQRVEQVENALVESKKRIEYLEQYLNIERVTEKPSLPVVNQPTETTSPVGEEALYKKAKTAFDNGDDETARKQFQALLKQYPKSKNADNAQFWIAEIFYREQWFEKAILEYQKIIESYPKGNKAPDAMLKQGLAFFKLGDKANARLLLKELIKKYPKTHAAMIAGKKIKEF